MDNRKFHRFIEGWEKAGIEGLKSRISAVVNAEEGLTDKQNDMLNLLMKRAEEIQS